MSLLVAIGVNGEGYREMLGICEGAKEDKAGWSAFPQTSQGPRPAWRPADHLRRLHGACRERCGVLLEAAWKRCIVHWYRNIFSHVPSTKVREIAAMLKAIHAGEDIEAARQKAVQVIEKLRGLRLTNAAELVAAAIEGRWPTTPSRRTPGGVSAPTTRSSVFYERSGGAPVWSVHFPTRPRQGHVAGAVGRQMSQIGEPAPGQSIQAPPQHLEPRRIIGPQRAHHHHPAITQRLLRTRRAAGRRHAPLPGFWRRGDAPAGRRGTLSPGGAPGGAGAGAVPDRWTNGWCRACPAQLAPRCVGRG